MAEELAAPPAPAGDAPLPSMQMYATWREKRVQRFSSGVERMRSDTNRGFRKLPVAL